MGNTKHTPGPWEIGYGDNSHSLGVFTKKMLDTGTAEPPICLVSPITLANDTDNANARLIAAAPELLEALEAVRRHGLIEKDGYETVVKIVGEAIIKATWNSQ